MQKGARYNKRVQVQRAELTSDGMGGTTHTWRTRHTALPCRIDATSVQETGQYGRISEAVTHRLFCRTIATEHGDRIIDGAHEYNVLSIREADFSATHSHLELRLHRVD